MLGQWSFAALVHSKVSAVGIGCNNFGKAGSMSLARGSRRCARRGITLFDTADIYGGR